MFPSSHVVSPDLVDNDDSPPLPDDTRQTRIRSHSNRFGEYVAHLSAYPPVYVNACCDPQQGVAREDIVEQPNLAFTVVAPPHHPPGSVVTLLSARDCVEPAPYRAALSSDQYAEWQVAMQHEYDSLLSNGTWELVDLPASREVVNNMWIYKIKSDLDGDASLYKARFVAKGCSKRPRLDYTYTLSSVIIMASLRLFLTISAAMNLELCQLDIDTAFLYVPITEDVDIRQPLGFTDGSAKVGHLKRCLYAV
jgi:hypothetical protein